MEDEGLEGGLFRDVAIHIHVRIEFARLLRRGYLFDHRHLMDWLYRTLILNRALPLQ